MSSLISIIIPIYNVAPYIEQCLQSVIDQTYTNLEVLLVDDCGSDDSMAIAERIVNNYHGPIQFHILHHNHNRGLSAARNTGIDASIGQYLFFLDSDDYISFNCIDALYRVAKTNNDAEMVIGRVRVNGPKQPWLRFLPPGVYSSHFIMKNINQDIYVMAWNKLIKRHWICDNNLYFTEGLNHEDILWSTEASCYLTKVISVDNYTYFYNVRDGSIQTSEDKSQYYVNLFKIKLHLISFLFERKLEGNTELFRFVNMNLYDILFQIYSMGKIDVARTLYQKYRKLPYWNLKRQICLKIGKKDIVSYFNRYLPCNLGFKYLISVRRKNEHSIPL